MKHPHGWIARRLRVSRPHIALVVGSALLAALGGCSGSSGIPNLTQSAPALPAMATYNGPRMNDPRYGHTATNLEDGTVLVIGGTDELYLTAFDTAEIFDQSARVDAGQPIPESIAGDFIDQNIDGDLIAMSNGGRFFHTATAIDDGQVMVIGGTTNILFGVTIGPSEIYDPQTRTFGETQIDPNNDIAFPRARHDARRLASGRVLITGGQESETVVLPPQPGFPPWIQFTQEARASTEIVEIFDPATLTFTQPVNQSGDPVELTTARGRSAHTTGQWAGFDNLLNTGDDVYGVIGGYMTLSAQSYNAPQNFLLWDILTTKQTAMDFYDTASGSMSLAQGLVLNRRVNHPIALNLGERNRFTPFGDTGMANAVYIIGGDSDDTCPDGAPFVGVGTADWSELVIATFTGFGPGNGVRFAVVPQQFITRCFPPVTSSVFGNGHEAALGCCTGEFSRSMTGAVLMEMARSYDGQGFITSVVVAGGGIDVTRRQVCFTTIAGGCDEIRGFQFFDPFYDIFHNESTGEEPWAWQDNGTNLNPLGIRGTTLMYDAAIADDTIDNIYDGSPAVAMNQGRAMHTLSRIPGEDGLLGSLDDRIAAIGGTNQYWPILGDDALSPSCEIFLPPDAGVVP